MFRLVAEDGLEYDILGTRRHVKVLEQQKLAQD